MRINQVYLFQDRLEIVSPGGLPASIKAGEFGLKSAPRNPLLFGMFFRMGLIEISKSFSTSSWPTRGHSHPFWQNRSGFPGEQLKKTSKS